MIVYRISDALAEGLPTSFAGTLADAHAAAKGRFSTPVTRSRCRVDQLDMPTDKAALVALLNAGADSRLGALDPVQTWGLTARGGLVQLSAGG